MNSLLHPERHVPLAARLTVLFGSGFQSIGWFFLGFGGLFVWIFVGATDVTSLLKFRGPLENSAGVIVASEKSGYSEGGSKRRRGTPIYRHHYTFDMDGKTHSGISYSKGGELSPGHAVTIEFPKGQPQISRIRGMRTAPFGPAVLFILIFPLIGFAFVIPGLLAGKRSCALLKCGELAHGRLTHKEQTNTRINKRYVYKLTFEYIDQYNQTHQATTKTHQPEKLEDDHAERLLFDPHQPRRVVFLDTLPGKVKVSEEGIVGNASTRGIIGALTPPALAGLIFLVGMILKMT